MGCWASIKEHGWALKMVSFQDNIFMLLMDLLIVFLQWEQSFWIFWIMMVLNQPPLEFFPRMLLSIMYRLKIEPFGSSGSIDDYPDHKCVTTLASIRRLRFFGWNQILSIISKSAKKGGVIVGRGFLTFYFVKTTHISYFPPSPILIIFSFGKSKRKICSVSKDGIFLTLFWWEYLFRFITVTSEKQG